MPIRTTVARLGPSAMLVLASAQVSLAQRIEPVAGISRAVSADTSRGRFRIVPTKGPLITWGGVAGSVAGGTAGLFGGMLAGVALANAGTCRGEDCSLGAALAAGVAGEIIGVAAGGHLGSARRGNLALAVLASAGVAAAGALGAGLAPRVVPGIVLSIPVLQTAAVLAVER